MAPSSMTLDKGQVVAHGPVMDPAGGYGVSLYRIADDQDIEAITSQDPVAKNAAGHREVSDAYGGPHPVGFLSYGRDHRMMAMAAYDKRIKRRLNNGTSYSKHTLHMPAHIQSRANPFSTTSRLLGMSPGQAQP
jgi:hypothetical protein